MVVQKKQDEEKKKKKHERKGDHGDGNHKKETKQIHQHRKRYNNIHRINQNFQVIVRKR